jgi:phenylalanyl-tRNA synthetase beta chain
VDGGGPSGALRPALGHPLVDISNYVMFELGRPSHLRSGQDQRRPECALGQGGRTLKLLNGNTIKIDDFLKVGVIADDKQVESLAGIMGGDATAVRRHEHLHRSRVLVPQGRGRPLAPLQLLDRRRHRFERGVDPSSPPSTSSASPRWC